MIKSANVAGAVATVAMELAHTAHAPPNPTQDGVGEPEGVQPPLKHLEIEPPSPPPTDLAIGQDELRVSLTESVRIVRFDENDNFLGHIISTEVKS